jgi:hypothetical protein
MLGAEAGQVPTAAGTGATRRGSGMADTTTATIMVVASAVASAVATTGDGEARPATGAAAVGWAGGPTKKRSSRS